MANRRGNKSTPDDVVKALINSNDQMGKDMEYLKNRLNALEMMQQPPQHNGGAITATATASDEAVTETANNTATNRRGIKWRDSMDTVDNDNGRHDAADNAAANKPPMRRIKFLDHHHPPLASNIVTDSPQNGTLLLATPPPHADNNNNNSSDASYSSSSVSSNDEAIAFSGWARVFFQARHHRSATQITSGATSTTSQDTYLYLTIHSTANELRISNTDDRWKPPLIDPPVPLKHFYAVKVPGSHSGAALFLKSDPSRRLRKYIFRFEFVNRSVHQPPARYLQFIRSGKAAKKSMRGIHKMKNVFNKRGEERNENIKADKKRAQDAFAAHLGTLDELLRESSESADRFVECVNTRNEEEEEELNMLRSSTTNGDGMMGESSGQRRKRSKPPPPYWGSGFNRPSTNENEEDEDNVDSDSLSEEDDDELYYDDDNDDETMFDKVQVSTEQTLETLFNHIVK
mmetsp:Transcript_3789/g.8441  ORF Transcript_3789/g.8441 Transcript_3789/m.8441 type:complete len:460 (+) Transcript_3789:308-1687(+)